MEMFELEYFDFNRRLFNAMGLWPYASKARVVRKYMLLLLLFIIIVPQVGSAIIHHKDIDRLFLNTTIFLIAIDMFLKVLAISVAEDDMKALYRSIAANWRMITDPMERQILFEFSERGRKKSFYYFVVFELGVAGLFVFPLLPKIMDKISPLAEPRPLIFILDGELLVDKETHYWYIYFWDILSVLLNSTVSVTVDGMYIVCLEQCCAMFAILRYRLKTFGVRTNSVTGDEIDSYNYFLGIIRLHQITLNLVTTVNRAFSKLLLFLVLNNMVGIPLSAVTVISKSDDAYNFSRFFFLFLLHFMHLFMLIWPAQNIISHGDQLIDDVYCNEWYNTSLRAKRMMLFFMRRCTPPAEISAGGLIVLNYATYASIVKTSVSYITVLASFR